jgi:hypothetical protein
MAKCITGASGRDGMFWKGCVGFVGRGCCDVEERFRGRGEDSAELVVTYATGKNERAFGSQASGVVLVVTLAQAGMPVLLGLVGRGAANFESDLGTSAAGDVG